VTCCTNRYPSRRWTWRATAPSTIGRSGAWRAAGRSCNGARVTIGLLGRCCEPPLAGYASFSWTPPRSERAHSARATRAPFLPPAALQRRRGTLPVRLSDLALVVHVDSTAATFGPLGDTPQRDYSAKLRLFNALAEPE